MRGIVDVNEADLAAAGCLGGVMAGYFRRAAFVVAAVCLAIAAGMSQPTTAWSQNTAVPDMARAKQLADTIERWTDQDISRDDLPPNYCEYRREARDLLRKLEQDAAFGFPTSSLRRVADRLADAEVTEHETWWDYDEETGEEWTDDPCFDFLRIRSLVAVYKSTGFYIGVNGGLATGTSRWDFTDGSTGNFPTRGGLFGGTFGYNWQNGQVVYGAEATVDWASISGSSTTNCFVTCRTKNSWLNTVDVRAGYLHGATLFYVKGGAAIGNIKQEIGTLPGSDQTKVGWNAGVGAELMINRYWSAKAEYMRVSLGSASCDAPCGFVNTPLVENLFMVGVNYHLGQ